MDVVVYAEADLARCYKTCFMLNSTEHEISTAHKTKVPANKEVSCY